jgi:hypothetical protein
MASSPRGRSLVTGVLLIGLATGAGWSTLALKHAGEDLIEAQTDLQEAATALREMDGWEWRAIGGAYPPTHRSSTSACRLRRRRRTRPRCR